MKHSSRIWCASLATAWLTAACGAPAIGARLQGTLAVTGSDPYTSGVVFEIPANLTVDCATFAQRGLYADQRRLQLLFMPAQLTQETPLQQLAISIASYTGPGRYAVDASSFGFALRSRRLASVEPGAEVVMAPDGSGSLRAAGQWEGGGDVQIDLRFSCAAA
jgi:hypothetical protein